MMKCLTILFLLSIHANYNTAAPQSKKVHSRSDRELINAKIYSHFAEIIYPLNKLPLEFSIEQWTDIRPDTITLIGTNVNITQQTVTTDGKEKMRNNQNVYIRSPTSSDTKVKYVKATLIDEASYLVKFIDTDISKQPLFYHVHPEHILYTKEQKTPKYYVNFTYQTDDIVYVSYLSSSLSWKTSYQLNLFEESKDPILIAMADIRNDGESSLNIEHADLLGGDINFRFVKNLPIVDFDFARLKIGTPTTKSTVSKGKEIAGLYLFNIKQPFSINANTNYVVPMFRPQVTVERFVRIYNIFLHDDGNHAGKAERMYRLLSNDFLSGGNCLIREHDYLVGESEFPDIAANDVYEISLGEDPDISYLENVTLISTRTMPGVDQTNMNDELQTESTYNITISIKNFKSNRSVAVEYKKIFTDRTMKLINGSEGIVQDGKRLKYKTKLNLGEEQIFSYVIETVQ